MTRLLCKFAAVVLGIAAILVALLALGTSMAYALAMLAGGVAVAAVVCLCAAHVFLAVGLWGAFDE